MSKKNSKKSFLEEPVMEAVNAAAKKAFDEIMRLPSLLEGQEDNLYLNEATQVAEIEAKLFGEALDHLSNVYKEKLKLLEAKVQLIDQCEKVPTSAISNDACEKISGEMKELKDKLKKRDLNFLRTNTQQPVRLKEPKRVAPSRSVSFQLYHDQSTAYISNGSTVQETSTISSITSTGFIGKPQFSSDMGRRMVADTEAQESARRTRSVFTPSTRQNSEFKRPVQTLPPGADKENQRITKEIFQSGGSSLDGSFLMNGVTMEDILRPRSVTPGRAIPSQPNFDDTGLDEFEEKVVYEIPIPPTDDAPPMNVVTKNLVTLGPLDPEMPVNPSRPQFSSSIGQKLSKK